jgi:hypothetical protein
MSDAYAPQRNDLRITHLDRALGNDNFCSKMDFFIICFFLADYSSDPPCQLSSVSLKSISVINYIREITAFFV